MKRRELNKSIKVIKYMARSHFVTWNINLLNFEWLIVMGIWYVSSLPLLERRMDKGKGSKLQAAIYEWEIIVIKCALGLMRRRVKQKQFSQDLHLDDYFCSQALSVLQLILGNKKLRLGPFEGLVLNKEEHSLEFNYVVLIVSCHWIGTVMEKEKKSLFWPQHFTERKTFVKQCLKFPFHHPKPASTKLRNQKRQRNEKLHKLSLSLSARFLFDFPWCFFQIEINISFSSTRNFVEIDFHREKVGKLLRLNILMEEFLHSRLFSFVVVEARSYVLINFFPA